MDKKGEPDINQIAAQIVGQTTNGNGQNGQIMKNPAAVALGRLGGLKGGKARAASLTEKQRKAIAKHAARARWTKKA